MTFLCEKLKFHFFVVSFPHFYDISCISEDAMIDKPVQCVKLLSLSPGSVNVRLFYENYLSMGTFEEFTYDGEKSRLMIMIIASFNKLLFCFSEVSW